MRAVGSPGLVRRMGLGGSLERLKTLVENEVA
jgi:hypothetical protein